MAAEKIERLEAELAEMRRKVAQMHGARLTWADRALKAEQRLIDEARFSVQIWEDCPNEHGQSTGACKPHTGDGIDCGGSGKRLKDGVVHDLVVWLRVRLNSEDGYDGYNDTWHFDTVQPIVQDMLAEMVRGEQ